MSLFDGIDRDGLRDGALERLRRLVELESPSHDEPRLRAVAADVAGQLTAAGAEVDTEDVPGVGEHVVATLAGTELELAPVLVLGHLDTVHPVGTFDPVFRVIEGRARGPGTFDMKGGWACMLEALARLHAADARPRRTVVLLATCDEETGSEHSRSLVEAMADGVHAALVLEPPFEDGAAKTRRKGVAWYQLELTGRASHAGLAPEAGINAVVEAAHQVLTMAALGDAEAGTTVTPTVLHGGTASNVVAPEARIEVDVRFTRREEAERVDEAIRSLRPALPGAELAVRGGINRLPMERTPETAALYERARALARASGWDLGEGLAGGASDGSLVAPLGVPVLDGIGPAGAGAHAPGEHVVVADLERRVRLYGRLLETL